MPSQANPYRPDPDAASSSSSSPSPSPPRRQATRVHTITPPPHSQQIPGHPNGYPTSDDEENEQLARELRWRRQQQLNWLWENLQRERRERQEQQQQHQQQQQQRQGQTPNGTGPRRGGHRDPLRMNPVGRGGEGSSSNSGLLGSELADTTSEEGGAPVAAGGARRAEEPPMVVSGTWNGNGYGVGDWNQRGNGRQREETPEPGSGDGIRDVQGAASPRLGEDRWYMMTPAIPQEESIPSEEE